MVILMLILTDQQFNHARLYMWLNYSKYINLISKELDYLLLAQKTAEKLNFFNEDNSIPDRLISLAKDHCALNPDNFSKYNLTLLGKK